ncbi:hypothetical protein MHYP_G00212680 [Metynnis hypsauchen]
MLSDLILWPVAALFFKLAVDQVVWPTRVQLSLHALDSSQRLSMLHAEAKQVCQDRLEVRQSYRLVRSVVEERHLSSNSRSAKRRELFTNERTLDGTHSKASDTLYNFQNLSSL